MSDTLGVEKQHTQILTIQSAMLSVVLLAFLLTTVYSGGQLAYDLYKNHQYQSALKTWKKGGGYRRILKKEDVTPETIKPKFHGEKVIIEYKSKTGVCTARFAFNLFILVLAAQYVDFMNTRKRIQSSFGHTQLTKIGTSLVFGLLIGGGIYYQLARFFENTLFLTSLAVSCAGIGLYNLWGMWRAEQVVAPIIGQNADQKMESKKRAERERKWIEYQDRIKSSFDGFIYNYLNSQNSRPTSKNGIYEKYQTYCAEWNAPVFPESRLWEEFGQRIEIRRSHILKEYFDSYRYKHITEGDRELFIEYHRWCEECHPGYAYKDIKMFSKGLSDWKIAEEAGRIREAKEREKANREAIKKAKEAREKEEDPFMRQERLERAHYHATRNLGQIR